MLEYIYDFSISLFAFLAVLTVLVYIHELGHYLAARQCGVRVEVFSIGFGPEIFGKTASNGTRWKFSAVPFGGYVKMFGEQAPIDEVTTEQFMNKGLEESFYNKPLRQRAWIVFAGPLANFLFAILILAGLFVALGEPHTPPSISTVQPGSAAERGGLKPGDVFLEVDGEKIDRFEELRRVVQISPNRELSILVKRQDQTIRLNVTPDAKEETRFGTSQQVGRLGVARGTSDLTFVRYDPFTALYKATVRTVKMSKDMLAAVGQIIVGERTAKELGGPIKIAQISGEMAQAGFVMLIQFAAILSINLGLINLFPVPLLDGGHLMFYLVEAVRGKPVGQKAMTVSLNIGLFLILALTVFVTWNDLVQSSLGRLFQ
ncbi:MAG: RIP metalloprotease RseP [Pseudomonadota bacterium]|nr:RIP metalloprotease RseP [Pseudomonadota bacterium]